jgi:hypothetical protein
MILIPYGASHPLSGGVHVYSDNLRPIKGCQNSV